MVSDLKKDFKTYSSPMALEKAILEEERLGRAGGEGKRGPRAKFTILPNKILDDPDLSCHEKMILWILFRHAQLKGECWPSQKLIKKESGIGRRQIKNALKTLNSKGKIEILRTGGSVNLYRLKI